MNCEEAIRYLTDQRYDSIRPGLERTRELMERLGSPEKDLKFVHVAGSNGKGSTCAMIESVLRAAGYRTGFYLSPGVESFQEAFQICGVPISDDELSGITEQIRDAADAMADHPSQFEMKTAAAFLYFRKNDCDIVVLETGLGGELDSTNVIPAPECAVIVNIGLEHTDYLGNTLGEIARAKAGIIKTGSDVVCYRNTDEVIGVIRETCEKKGCPLTVTDPDQTIRLIRADLSGQVFEWKGTVFSLPLLGAHQLKNAAVALTALEILQKRGFRISQENIAEGLAFVKWPVRFEVISKDPVFIIDCAHNPQCVQALSAMIRTYLPGEKITLLMGVLADKDYPAMIGMLQDLAEEFICITPDSPRALSAQSLAEALKERGNRARAFEDEEEAVKACIASGRPVVTCTSLYISGKIRKISRKLLQRE